jgi:hypothetical protein
MTADQLASFCTRVAAYRRATRASVTSWGRSRAHNKAVGGLIDSYHLFDLAVDVVYDEPIPLGRRQDFAHDLHLALFPEPDHDHLQDGLTPPHTQEHEEL